VAFAYASREETRRIMKWVVIGARVKGIFVAITLVTAAQAPADAGALLRGSIEDADCDTVEVAGPSIGPARAALGEHNEFGMRLPVEEAGYFTLRCGKMITLFLSPGDSLEVTVTADGTAGFHGRGAKSNQFLSDMKGLRDQHGPRLLRSYFDLAALQEEAFLSAWDSVYAVLFDPLNEALSERDVPELAGKVERAKVLYPWAEGRARYPFLRWRSTGTDVMSISDRYDEYLSRLDLNDASLLSIEEYTSFLSAHVHEQARRARRREPALASGDNQWTRAEYEIALRAFTDVTVRDHVLHSIIVQHLDRYGSKGLDEILARFRRDCADQRLLAEVDDAYAKDRTYWDGHETEVYKSVDGVDLDAHLFRPQDVPAGERRAALAWLHGGSWSEGAWYWCPGLCSRLVSEGMVVVQVEYRIQDRHGSTPFESIADAKSAIRWVRANAGRLGVDPGRIVAAGFSAGGHLAAACAVLDGFDEPGEDLRISASPNAAVLVSACVDPTQDPWYRRIVADQGAPEDGSPAHHVRAGLPPMLALHGTGDRMCSFPVLSEFANQSAAAGNTCRVEAFEGRPHFFLWQSREDRTRALERTVAFLDSLGFVAKPE
jgi:acetyl esterase/lipase